MDVSRLTNGLTQRDDGIWVPSITEKVSYLEDGNATCFELEDESFWFAHRRDCIHALVQRVPPPGTLFDIGGGNGFMAEALSNAGLHAVIVEPGEVGARNALLRGIPTVICATLDGAHFTSGALPAVGLFDVLEHVADDVSFLREIHRCLAPEGRIYLTVPASRWLWSDDDVVAGHYRRYSMTSLLSALGAAGFQAAYATHIFSILPLPLLALRSVPSLFGRRTLSRIGYAPLHKRRSIPLIDRIWKAEVNAVAAGKRIHFGTTILVAADKCAIQR